jgi:hypothetical protein
MGMVGVLIAVLWLLHRFSSGPQWLFASIVVTLICCRLLAAVVVRASIKKSIKIAQHALRKQERGEVIIDRQFSMHTKTDCERFVFVVVPAEMLARGMIRDIDQPSALLIATTTSIVPSIAMETDPVQRILHPVGEECVQVVHGTADEVFCPHQERWNETDVSLHRLYNNHVFLLLASKRQLIEILSGVLRCAQTRV